MPVLPRDEGKLAVVDFVTVKAPKSHRDQQDPMRGQYVSLSEALIFTRFQ
jgi:hypothetical protein